MVRWVDTAQPSHIPQDIRARSWTASEERPLLLSCTVHPALGETVTQRTSPTAVHSLEGGCLGPEAKTGRPYKVPQGLQVYIVKKAKIHGATRAV